MAEYFQSPDPPSDGTEGTAAITLILQDEKDKDKKILITRDGCIIENNKDMKNFLNLQHESDFFVYFSYDLPQNWKTQSIEYEVKVHRYTSPGKPDKFCKITERAADFILEKDGHTFLILNFKMFKLKPFSNFPQFLNKHCKRPNLKNFQMMHVLNNGQKMFGLKKETGHLPKFFEISYTSKNSTFLLRDTLFKQLANGPMLCDKEVVGWCRKVANSPDKITLYTFAHPGGDRKKSIKEALLSKEELADDVARMLDAKPLSNATKNWKYYGKKLGIPDNDLDLIERDGKNPAKELLLYVYHAIDKEKKTAGGFRKIIMEFEDRKDLHNLVNVDLNIMENDSRPLADILPPHSDKMKKITALLNYDCNGTLPNWKQLAQKWGIPYKIYDRFDYENIPGPTEKLMDWVESSDHQISVQEFLDVLGELPRYDIKEALEDIIGKAINTTNN